MTCSLSLAVQLSMVRGPMHCVSEGLRVPIASSGIGFPDDKIHAPNENARIDYFLKGILHAAAILEAFGKSRG